MYCPSCGRENADGSRFCSGCGKAIGPTQPAPPAPPTSSPAQPAIPLNYQQPVYPQAQRPYVPSNLGLAIFVTLCCCQIFGIISLVYAAQVSSKLSSGDVAGAQAASDTAKKWAIAGLIGGVIIWIIMILFQVYANMQMV